jgi:hypothetical protein
MEYHMLVVVVLLQAETKVWFAKLVCHYIKRSFSHCFFKIYLMNIFKLYSLVPKPTNIRLYLSVWIRHQRNIWTVRFDFDRPHIFIGHRRIYGAQAYHYVFVYIRTLTDEYRRDLKT